ncbi:site-specific integrase [Citrobacter freundii]|uniref:hypothetical protein n=1 Tax=Citrobacter freundii TaxID=546 RepID=UPI0019081BBD|nr:hypothetical protein [Citrobacter freundii]MBJ8931593.1 hypothetical protein [Citrobacter freundii]
MEAITKLDDLQDSTRESYFKIIGSMMRQTNQIEIRGGLIPMIEHLEKRFSNKEIVRASARLYKSALLYAIVDDATRRMDQNESLDQSIEMYSRVHTLQTTQLLSKSNKTSSLRRKHFSNELIDQLVELAISNKRFKKLRESIAFIKANNVIGLRPVEWQSIGFFNYLDKAYISQATAIDNCSTLGISINNAKFTSGRSFGPTREMILAGINEDKLSWITNFNNLLTKALGNKIGYERDIAAKEYMKSLQKALYDALVKLQIPKEQRPTIYSTRHQCISNAKKRGLSPIQIAALFGHASIETAKIHYGKKQHGRSAVSIIPSKESINAVEFIMTRKNISITIEPSVNALSAAQILLNK